MSFVNQLINLFNNNHQIGGDRFGLIVENISIILRRNNIQFRIYNNPHDLIPDQVTLRLRNTDGTFIDFNPEYSRVIRFRSYRWPLMLVFIEYDGMFYFYKTCGHYGRIAEQYSYTQLLTIGPKLMDEIYEQKAKIRDMRQLDLLYPRQP
jgi:hypothetical protein